MKLGCKGRYCMVFNAPFNNISVSFIGGENWSTRRKSYCHDENSAIHKIVVHKK